MTLESEKKEQGLSVVAAALFLAGEIAGSGVLALPGALVGAGVNFTNILRAAFVILPKKYKT